MQSRTSLIAEAPATLEPSLAQDEVTRLRATLEAAPVSLARISADGTLLALNQAAVALLGVTRAADALQRPFARHISPADAGELAAFVARVAGGEPGTLELKPHSTAGIERALELSGAPLPIDGLGRASGLFVFRDVGTRRALELAALTLNDRAHEDAALLDERARTIDILGQRLSDAEADRSRLQAELAARAPSSGATPEPASGAEWRGAEMGSSPEFHRPPAAGPTRGAEDGEPRTPAPAADGSPSAIAAGAGPRVAELEAALGSLTAERTALAAELEAVTRTGHEHARRAQEAEIERVAVLKTAEYLEAQRAHLADALRQAQSSIAHFAEERETLSRALADAGAAHATEQAETRAAADRLAARLDSLEAAHARAVASQAGLQVEIARLRTFEEAAGQTSARHAALEAEMDALRAELRDVTERHATLEHQSARQQAEYAGAKEALREALADLEDLTTWGKAKSHRLAHVIRGGAESGAGQPEGTDARLC